MKYNIQDSLQLAQDALLKFHKPISNIKKDFVTSIPHREIKEMLQLEEYIKYTKKTVKLNSLRKRLFNLQNKFPQAIYRQNKIDIYDLLSTIVTAELNNRIESSFDDFAPVGVIYK